MILKKEIEKIAEDREVTKTTIDKDWVLGHVLDAIFSIKRCRESLVFRGGTCLKKCYFPDYRFSEDLDFTSIHSDFVLDEKLISETITIVKERAGIPLHLYRLDELRFNDKLTGFSAILRYWGAEHSKNQAPPAHERWLTGIKLEAILYELLVFPPEERKIIHDYSDKLSDAANSIPCYTLREVLAEKLRSLIQRSYTAPRDFFDIWYLSKKVADLNWPEIVAALHKKIEFKGLAFRGVDQILNEDNHKILKKSWDQSLKHQVSRKDFQGFDVVEKDLAELFKKIFV